MIAFKIHLKEQQDLLEEDASLSLGWFEVSTKGFNGHFFRDGYCMVFLTLGTLLDQMNKFTEASKGKELWIGEDHGAVVEMARKKDVLELTTSEITMQVPFDEFKEAIVKETNDFIDQCENINPSILSESAFNDLVDSFTAIVRS
jgi:hypothetical protein